MIIAAAVFIFLRFFCFIETEDVWWHLSVGRWIVEHHQVPHVDPFPFAQERIPWTSHSEWLGSVVLFLVYKYGGILGLKVFRSCFFVLAGGIFVAFARRRLPMVLSAVLLLTASYGFLQRTFLRPDMFNLIFIQLFLIQMILYETYGRRRDLMILPLLGIIWFNLHMGAAVYGPLLFLIFMFSAAVRRSLGAVGDLALVFLCFLLGFLVNPYGLEGFIFPFKAFLDPSFIGFYKISAAIAENQPPAYLFLSFRNTWFYILLAAGLTGLYLNQKNRFSMTLLFMAGLFMYLCALRTEGFFILATVYVFIKGAEDARWFEGWKAWPWSTAWQTTALAAVLLFCGMQTLNLLQAKVFYAGRLEPALSVDVNRNSRDAIVLLRDHGISGPVFNVDVMGGEIIWEAYPQLKPFVDGRFLDKERFNNFHAILERPADIWPLAVRDYGFTAAILNAGDDAYHRLIKHVLTDPGWILIGVKGPLVVFVKKGAFVLPDELTHFQDRLARARVSPAQLAALGFFISSSPGKNPTHVLKVDFFTEAAALAVLGYKEAAIEKLIRGFDVADGPYFRNLARAILKDKMKI